VLRKIKNSMGRKKKIDSKEAGLEIGLFFFKFFLKSEYLHYGFFPSDLPTDITNLAKAQENYAELLLSNIPSGVKTILDVGCGSGKMAEKLISKGYDVDTVSPGVLLTKYVQNKLGNQITIHNCKFEDFSSTKKYDLILFSESFQYIPIEKSLEGFKKFASPNGYMMICDFFRLEDEGKSLLGGGHSFKDWEATIQRYPFKKLKEQDITDQTAPTIDLVNALALEVLHPTWKTIFLLGEDRFPLLLKFVKWKYKKKIQKMENKHFSGQRNGVNFKKYKKYMLYIFQTN